MTSPPYWEIKPGDSRLLGTSIVDDSNCCQWAGYIILPMSPVTELKPVEAGPLPGVPALLGGRTDIWTAIPGGPGRDTVLEIKCHTHLISCLVLPLLWGSLWLVRRHPLLLSLVLHWSLCYSFLRGLFVFFCEWLRTLATVSKLKSALGCHCHGNMIADKV